MTDSEESKGETQGTIVCAVKGSSPTSQRTFNWAVRNPLGLAVSQIIVLHVANKKKKSEGEQVVKNFLRETHSETKFTLKTAVLEVDKHGVGHTIKAYCRDLCPLVLVVGDSMKRSALRAYLSECDSYCPVVLAKSDLQDSKKGYEHIAIGVADNPHSNNGFQFLLKNIRIPKTSQLVVVHVVTNKTDKTSGRDYLSSFKPQCKGKPYAIRSALVYARKERTIPGGIATFCRERKVELMCLSPKPQGGKKARAGGRIVSLCMDTVSSDILIFKDEHTQEAGEKVEGAGGFSPRMQLVPRLSSRWLNVDDSTELTDDVDDVG